MDEAVLDASKRDTWLLAYLHLIISSLLCRLTGMDPKRQRGLLNGEALNGVQKAFFHPLSSLCITFERLNIAPFLEQLSTNRHMSGSWVLLLSESRPADICAQCARCVKERVVDAVEPILDAKQTITVIIGLKLFILLSEGTQKRPCCQEPDTDGVS